MPRGLTISLQSLIEGTINPTMLTKIFLRVWHKRQNGNAFETSEKK